MITDIWQKYDILIHDVNQLIPADESIMDATSLINCRNAESNWCINFDLDAAALKSRNILPSIVECVTSLLPITADHSITGFILTEAFNNALEHGLLKLDSSLKTSAEGYSAYYMQRQQRLGELNQGRITICLRHAPVDAGRGRLMIEVSDTGSGFEYHNYSLVGTTKYYGRGIALLKKLCTNIEYSAKGNRLKLVSEYLIS